tara:strand:+ start:26 stop:1645 length:1620 start_codon:yes stop_codon:yes gene_type:complete
MQFDTLIINGKIVDGSGKSAFKADVGILNQKIAAIGSLKSSEAKKVINAENLIVSPGFIDMHTHSDISLINDPYGESKAHQGVTTEVTGNCSYSPFPCGKMGPKGLHKELWEKCAVADDPNTNWTWNTLDEWANTIENNGVSINIAPQLGYAALQVASGANEDRRATYSELKEMKYLATEAIEQGAFSISTGLSVPPSAYASTEEVVEICKALSHYEGVFYATHAREGAGRHLSKIIEAVDIGKKANISVQFSHLAITDWRHYGEGPKMHQLFDKAVQEGLDITYDMYPYTAAGAGLDQMIPLWAQSGGLDEYMARLKDVDVREKIRKEVSKGIGGLAPLWQKVIMSSAKKDKNKGLIGMSIEDISKKRKTDPAETVLQLVEEEKGAVPVTVHNRVESDIRCFMDHPLAMFGSDGNAVSPEGFYRSGQPHPRFYGTYPRVLGRYVREKPSVLSLEDAIYKMTGFPAKRLGMKNRGQIKKDYIADLTIFDPKVVIDNATFEEPHQLPSGIPFVFVAGVIIIDNGKHSRKKPGKVLRRGTE